MKIYLFRHGQTEYNEKGLFTGWTDVPLSKNGVKDAKKVAKKLEKKKIDIAFCSSLKRSRQTLREVLKHHPECKIVMIDDRIVERHYGDLQRKKHSTIINKYGQKQYDIWHRSYDIPPPNGESIKDVEIRVKSFIRDMKKLDKKLNIAISAHGNSMRPFRRYFEKFSKKEMMKLENPWDEYFEYKI